MSNLVVEHKDSYTSFNSVGCVKIDKNEMNTSKFEAQLISVSYDDWKFILNGAIKHLLKDGDKYQHVIVGILSMGRTPLITRGETRRFLNLSDQSDPRVSEIKTRYLDKKH